MGIEACFEAVTGMPDVRKDVLHGRSVVRPVFVAIAQARLIAEEVHGPLSITISLTIATVMTQRTASGEG